MKVYVVRDDINKIEWHIGAKSERRAIKELINYSWQCHSVALHEDQLEAEYVGPVEEGFVLIGANIE